MHNLLISKLENGVSLTDMDRTVLADVTRHTRRIPPHQDIIRQGDRPEFVHLILQGFACRYKVLSNGDRQIVAFLLPGDFCDLHIALLATMDHGIATLSACTVVDIPRATIIELTTRHPRIARALWWCTLVDEAVLREWLVNAGQRDAEKRMAHLFCELLVRLQAVGLTNTDGYELPLTQTELADTLCISAVHVNRALQVLREAGLVEFRSKQVSIPGWPRLTAYCAFDASYLHLTKRQDDTKRFVAPSVC